MAEPVIVPIKAEFVDIDTSKLNFKDVDKEVSKSMSGIKKSIEDAFKSINPSAINKPIEKSMTAIEKGWQSTEKAYSALTSTMRKAGESTKTYQDTLGDLEYGIDMTSKRLAMSKKSFEENVQTYLKYKNIKEKAENILAEDPQNESARLRLKDAEYEMELSKKRGLLDEANIKRDTAALNDLISKREKLNPLDFIDDADPAQLERVSNAYKNWLNAVGSLNKKNEEFNQTIKDNRASDEYNELVKQAEKYRKKLAALNEKSKEMEFKGATDTQWENLRKDTEWTSLQMDEIIKKLETAVRTGKAFRFGDGPREDFRNQINSFKMSAQNNATNTRVRIDENTMPEPQGFERWPILMDSLAGVMVKVRDIAGQAAKGFTTFTDTIHRAVPILGKIDAAMIKMATSLGSGIVEKARAFGSWLAQGFGKASQAIGAFTQKMHTTVPILGKIDGAIAKFVSTTAAKAGSAIGSFATKIGKGLSTVIQKAGGVGKVLNGVVAGFGAILKGAGAAAKGIAKGFGAVGKVLGKVGSYVGKLTSNFFGNRASRSNRTGIQKLTRNVLMFGFGFRTVYSAVKRLRNTFVEGFKAMGDQFDEFGTPMKTMMEAFNRLKASLATAFQPLVSVVLPIMTKVMNYLTGMLEAIGKFNAALTGQGYIYKAVAKDIDSMSLSAKNANKQLGSYDKLEVIQKDDSYEYEKAAVGGAEDASSNFAQMVKEAWESANFTGVGQFITEKLLGILDNVEKNIIPKLTTFANKILKSVNTFIDGFDTKKIGTAVGSIINVFAEGLSWDQLGKAFANLNNVVWRFLAGLVNTIDWKTLGQKISEGLKSLVSTLDFQSLAEMWSGLIFGVLTVISEIDWVELATKLFEGIMYVLQTVADKLSTSDNPIVSAIGDTLNNLLPALASLADLVSVFASFMPIISAVLPPIAAILSQIVTAVMPVLVALMGVIMPILQKLMDIILPIISEILTALQPVFDAITGTVLPVIIHLLDVLMPLIESVLGLVTNILAPITSLLGPLLEIVAHILNPIISILEPIIVILRVLCDLVGNVLRPILDVLTPALSAVSSIFAMLSPLIEVLLIPLNLLTGVLQFVASLITGIVVPVIKVLMSIIEALCNVVKIIGDAFTTAFSVVQYAVQNAANAIKGVFNSILSFIESVANGIIRGVNKMISALNTLSFNIPDWIPGIGGKKFGFNLSQISEIRIPRLAQGAVIPPNKEFLAMLGDQKSGTNIEAPLDTIKQALAEVLAEVGGGNREPIVLQVSGRTLAKVVWDEQEKRYKQTGKSMA